jgi:hypothetical protein
MGRAAPDIPDGMRGVYVRFCAVAEVEYQEAADSGIPMESTAGSGRSARRLPNLQVLSLE